MRRRRIVNFFFEVRGIVLACPISAKLPWAPKDLFCIRCTVITPNSRSPFWDSVALIRFQIHSSRYPHLRYFNGTIQLLGHVRGDAIGLPQSHRNGPNVRFPRQLCADFSRFLQAHSSCIYLHVPCFFSPQKTMQRRDRKFGRCHALLRIAVSDFKFNAHAAV